MDAFITQEELDAENACFIMQSIETVSEIIRICAQGDEDLLVIYKNLLQLLTKIKKQPSPTSYFEEKTDNSSTNTHFFDEFNGIQKKINIYNEQVPVMVSWYSDLRNAQDLMSEDLVNPDLQTVVAIMRQLGPQFQGTSSHNGDEYDFC